MSRKPSHLAVAADPRAERGDATRQKLLEASIDVFGRLGFDGATTRAVADAAGVNLQAIPYYFGSKDGLFIATAEHIATRIKSQFAELYGRVQARLAEAEAQGIAIEAKEARELLTEIIQLKATLYISDEFEVVGALPPARATGPDRGFRSRLSRRHEAVVRRDRKNGRHPAR